MFSPTTSEVLRERGHRVVGVERVDLRAMAGENLILWATARKTWLLTENVKDFRPLMMAALQSGSPTPGLLFTSNRTFPRSRQHPGPLIDALDAWLRKGPPESPIIEDWLMAP